MSDGSELEDAAVGIWSDAEGRPNDSAPFLERAFDILERVFEKFDRLSLLFFGQRVRYAPATITCLLHLEVSGKKVN